MASPNVYLCWSVSEVNGQPDPILVDAARRVVAWALAGGMAYKADGCPAEVHIKELASEWLSPDLTPYEAYVGPKKWAVYAFLSTDSPFERLEAEARDFLAVTDDFTDKSRVFNNDEGMIFKAPILTRPAPEKFFTEMYDTSVPNWWLKKIRTPST